MAIASSSSLVDALRQYRLLEIPQLEELLSLQAQYPDPKALARELIQRGWLTPFQANQLFQGKGADLLLGSYVLLERLAEGGMGQVFKAKNWKLGRTVALKVLRKERLANPDDIRRFEREVRAAAALSHPNIVLAYDADQIGGTHMLVMEYVAGAIDLARLVKKQGPLPVAWACEFIRQAALGLQHAHEQGMVHRDIKPANLLLGADRKVVKVLDMGLVRRDQTATGESMAPMTQLGVVMGTPDYMAPEQAMESHTVDIRADLYSLGCTFYFLLAGRPLPTGSLIHKMFKHQNEEPPAVETLRPEVPPGVARVVRKLMAKKPADRYQTPAEVAEVLISVLSPGSGPAEGEERTMAVGPPALAGDSSLGDTLASPFADLSPDTAESFHSTLNRPAVGRRRWLLWIGVAAILILAGVATYLAWFYQGAGGPKPPREEPQPGAALTRPQPPLPDSWLRQVAALPADKQVAEVTAKLKERNPGFDGQLTHTIEGGVVTELEILTDNVTDLAPLRALSGLRKLNCSGTSGKGQLADLAPLKDLKLTTLTCTSTQVEDLGPLQGMKLTSLRCAYTKVSDLLPLKNMPLTTLICHDTQVTDLAPLKALPLRILWCDFKAERDAALLRSIKTLIQINGKSAQEFWKEVDGKKA